jgi:hypothetical protein
MRLDRIPGGSEAAAASSAITTQKGIRRFRRFAQIMRDDSAVAICGDLPATGRGIEAQSRKDAKTAEKRQKGFVDPFVSPRLCAFASLH